VTLLEVEGLDQFYGDFQALFGISLRVEEGEVVAVIGANGAGKSTLLRTVAGLLPAPSGAVRFDGRPVGHRPAHERVGMGVVLVPEGRRIFPSLTVEENLLVGGYGRRRGPWTLRKVYDLFPLLEPLASRPGAVLSGGEQQALAIGRALMANPRLLLMDEISLGLAPVVVRQLYDALPAIAADGTTMVVVEQDVTQALRIADRAYCFLEGRVSLEGRPDQFTREQIRAAYFGM
jgi:branched-chain amino acid transport system ATP-binding protein